MSLWVRTEGGNLFNLDRAAVVEKRAHDIYDDPARTHYVMARPAMTQNALAVRLFEGTGDECDAYLDEISGELVVYTPNRQGAGDDGESR